MKTIEYPKGYNKEKGITKEERRGCFFLTGVLLSAVIIGAVYGIIYIIISLTK